jgi:hypothetical protein
MKIKMKKKAFISLTVAAALSIGLAGCSQSEDVADGGQTPSTNKQTVTFVSGEETTRTSMGGKYDASTFPFYWEGGDKIYVNAVQSDGTTSSGISSAIEGTVDGSTAFSQQPHAIFTGTDVPTLPTGGSYKVRYTGTGTYTSSNQRVPAYSFSTTSDANTLVIPPVQTISDFSKTDVSDDNYVSNIGAIGDCGTATATDCGSYYKFKLDHKAAYLILMPRWEGNAGNYMLKSVTVTTRKTKYLLSGRFMFDDNGIGSCVYSSKDATKQTNGSCTIKIITGGSDGLKLPEAATTTDENGKTYRSSIIVAMKPVTDATPLYCIYEVYDNIKKETYYIEKVIGTTADGGTLTSNLSFAANSVTPVTANIKGGYEAALNNPTGSYLDVITNKNPYSGFYEWDVPDGEEYFVSHEMGDDYNAITSGVASKGCSSCPTYNQITWYLAGGCYWDADKKWGPADNQKGGMWLKKRDKLIADHTKASDGTTELTAVMFDNSTQKSGIATVTSTTYSPQKNQKNTNLWITERPTDLDTNWFFLPSASQYTSSTGLNTFSKVHGYYQSKTPQNSMFNWYLVFFEQEASVNKSNKLNGLRLWTVQ